jgi:hypothetical protein
MLPETIRDCSDLVFCVNVFTTIWRLQHSGEARNHAQNLLSSYQSIRCGRRTRGCSVVRYEGPCVSMTTPGVHYGF